MGKKINSKNVVSHIIDFVLCQYGSIFCHTKFWWKGKSI